MTHLEKLRTSKPSPRWLPWVWLVSAVIWLVVLILNLRDNPGVASINAACFAATLLAAYAFSQHRLNQDLLREIDQLKAQVAAHIGNTPLDSADGPE